MSNRFNAAGTAVTILLLTVASSSAETVNFNNNCEGQVPSGQGGKWFGSCPDPIYDETNWEGNTLPGDGDVAVIGIEYGPVEVNGTQNDARVASVQAPGGLVLDVSSYGLTLTSGDSFITDLLLSNNADLFAEAAAVVKLFGNTRLHSDVWGPGTYDCNDALNLNVCRLWEGAHLESHGAATLSGTYMQLGSSNSTFENSGTLTVTGTNCQVRGELSSFKNESTMSYSGSGNAFTLTPNYEQRGELSVLAGTMYIQGLRTEFQSGSISIASGAVLQLGPCTVSGTQDHAFSGVATVGGVGLLDVYDDYDVTGNLTLDVGSGTPDNGAGGIRLQSTLDLDGATLTNSGRFRFNNGVIGGTTGQFLNDTSGWVYTRSTGGGTIAPPVINSGNFQVGGGTLTVNSNVFFNTGTFRIVQGNVGGSGAIYNDVEFVMDASNAATISVVTCEFFNRLGGSVHVIQGHLTFSNVSNIEIPGVLDGGEWWVQSPGTLTFPEQIHELGASTRLIGRQASFPNVDVDLIASDAEMKSDSWDLEELDLNGTLRSSDDEGNYEDGNSEGRVGELPGIRIDGILSIAEGGRALVEPAAQLSAGQIQNGVDVPGDMPAELAGVPGTGVATVETPLLESRGRILPGGHDAVGTIELIGNLLHHTDGELLIDLNGLFPGDEFDQLSITGDATLAGSVVVSSLPGFTPQVGQEFTILTTTGTITGAFDDVISTNQYNYSLVHNPDHVVLAVDSANDVPGSPIESATRLSLSTPHPNPFRPQTTIEYYSPCSGDVSLSILEPSGRRVALLVESLPLGGGMVTWDGRDDSGRELASGVFLVRLSGCGDAVTRKVVLAR